MTGAGELRELVNMQTRTEDGDDGYGGVVVGDWETFWSASARVQILRGTETVMAGRLTGVQTVAITMRWQPEMEAVFRGTWRIKNARTGAIYDITSIETDERKSFVNILTKKQD